jgi:tetratricopeptide (TPR) repeat protein
MAELPDHYAVLGVAPSADEATIKAAYRERIRKYHPDRYSGELAQARADEDVVAIRRAEKRLEQAKQQTKRINTAYRTLKDPAERRRYDRLRQPPTRVEFQDDRTGPGASRSYSYARNAQNTQNTQANTGHTGYTSTRHGYDDPGNQRARATAEANRRGDNDEKVPWAFMGALVIVLALVFTGLTSMFNLGPRDYVVGATELPAWRIPAGSVDATATAVANMPTPTPRDSSANIQAANVLFERQSYTNAIELYTRVIDSGDADAFVYFRRAESYRVIGELDAALTDYNIALATDASLTDAYLGRGLAYYGQWWQTRSDTTANAARTDLERYQESTGADDADLRAILADLPQ